MALRANTFFLVHCTVWPILGHFWSLVVTFFFFFFLVVTQISFFFLNPNKSQNLQQKKIIIRSQIKNIKKHKSNVFLKNAKISKEKYQNIIKKNTGNTNSFDHCG